MENLTKENFWNALYEKYPDGMKVFCNWIDDYKIENNWNRLFNDGVREFQYVKNAVKHTKAPKFHDLPLAMQMGIWIEFVSSRDQHWMMFAKNTRHDVRVDITEFISQLDKQIKMKLHEINVSS